MLYGISTGNFNKAASRNLDRFPSDFMFKLNKQEFKNLIFQFGTSSWGVARKLPRLFMERSPSLAFWRRFAKPEEENSNPDEK